MEDYEKLKKVEEEILEVDDALVEQPLGEVKKKFTNDELELYKSISSRNKSSLLNPFLKEQYLKFHNDENKDEYSELYNLKDYIFKKICYDISKRAIYYLKECGDINVSYFELIKEGFAGVFEAWENFCYGNDKNLILKSDFEDAKFVYYKFKKKAYYFINCNMYQCICTFIKIKYLSGDIFFSTREKIKKINFFIMNSIMLKGKMPTAENIEESIGLPERNLNDYTYILSIGLDMIDNINYEDGNASLTAEVISQILDKDSNNPYKALLEDKLNSYLNNTLDETEIKILFGVLQINRIIKKEELATELNLTIDDLKIKYFEITKKISKDEKLLNLFLDVVKEE